MTNNLYLNWALMAVSLTNTILLIWLGLTVMLNSDRRTWGIGLASSGLLLGGAFFVSHTAILAYGFVWLSYWGMIFWWTVGLIPAIVLPFAWYMIMLWYAGYWEESDSELRQRQRGWFYLVLGGLGIGLIVLGVGVVLLLIPDPAFTNLRLSIRWSVAGIPILALGYAIYVLLCFGLALDALRHPGPSTRLMGTVARQRARPWLMTASIVQLPVSLFVAGTMVWLIQASRQRTFFDLFLNYRHTLALLDLGVATLIGIAVWLLGQAVVSYEVFTGRTLPRHGLLRHWQRAVLLAIGYGVVIGASTVSVTPAVYTLLLSTLLIACFYALFSWRSYAERERYIEHLRPFVTSQRLYEQLITPTAPPSVDIVTPFRALCADLLDARVAYLLPLGSLAPLVGSPLAYPAMPAKPLPSPALLAAQFPSPNAGSLPIDPAQHGGAIWAVPLWSARGLIGLFLLGEKRGGGLYAQEEIEMVKVSGERLIDTQASTEIARRLMALQRERLAQTQLIDQQTRRALHDEILPTLHTAMITLGGTGDTNKEAIRLLTDAHQQISNLLRQMPTIRANEVARLGLVGALQELVQELGQAFNGVSWQITPLAAEQASKLPLLTAEVIFYAVRELIRNAALHGRGEDAHRPLHLQIGLNWKEGLLLEIEDDGVGFDLGSTERGNSHPKRERESAGTGQGLALHTTMMAVIGGTLVVESLPQQYTRVTLHLK